MHDVSGVSGPKYINVQSGKSFEINKRTELNRVRTGGGGINTERINVPARLFETREYHIWY